MGSYLIVLRIADDLDFERLAGLEREAALLLFMTPATALARVAHSLALIETRVEVKDNVSTVVRAAQQVEFESGCIVVRSTADVDHTT